MRPPVGRRLNVLRGVDLRMAPGEVLVLIGRSGSGKSTLVRCVAGLTRIDGGRLEINGVTVQLAGTKLPRTAIRQAQGRVGMVFQDFNLFPHLYAGRNVSLALQKVRRLGHADAAEQAIKALSRVGLGAFSDRFPHQLSGGQQQRVAIARALALRPEIMLFNEPTSAFAGLVGLGARDQQPQAERGGGGVLDVQPNEFGAAQRAGEA